RRTEQHRRRLGRGGVCAARRVEDTSRSRAPARGAAALHELGIDGGGAMTVIEARPQHRVEAAGRPFVDLADSASVFGLDDAAEAVLAALAGGRCSRDELAERLTPVCPAEALDETLAELERVRAIAPVVPTETRPDRPKKVFPLTPFPVSTTVINVTNQCNLGCTYCYEYGDDRIVDTGRNGAPKFMTEETARQSVDFALRESGSNPVAHITFFGGETLLNFRVLKKTVAYARERAAMLGK